MPGRTLHNSRVQFISDIYAAKKAANKPVISFEFFPLKTEEAEHRFFEQTVPALMELKPDYCSVTYGAGGSTRDKTLAIVDRIQREHRLPVMTHLTCVSATREEVRAVLTEAKNLGIHNILALRGDPPAGTGEFKKTEGGFEYSYQLVRFIREIGGFCIGTAGFPEGHIACKEGKYADWKHLQEKIDSGSDFVLTQLFFENADFFEFRDHLTRTLGVTAPICPGILPILSASQIKRFTELCGAHLPAPLLARLEELAHDDQAAREFGIEYATKQCAGLLRAGVPGLHLYTLNRVYSTRQVLKNLGLA